MHLDHDLGTYLRSLVPAAPHLVSYSNHRTINWPDAGEGAEHPGPEILKDSVAWPSSRALGVKLPDSDFFSSRWDAAFMVR
jgi:hypothetical protein